MNPHSKTSAVSTAGLLISLGIIYGDIGTSPLYVMKAIIGDAPISQTLVYGGISCVFWTLTLQTTLKYVLLTLQADNNGEGGIFSLYTLIRRRAAWLIVPAMLGGAALLADGIITPPISVSSAIEGLRILYPHIPTVPIVLAILTALFVLQRFGTVMYIWIQAFHIKRSLAEYVRLKDYLPGLMELSADETIPKYATHLVFMSSAPHPKEIESKVIYSIFQKRPKRADIYWFVHVETTDEPYTSEYKVRKLAEGDVIRIDFRLGFRVEQRINLFFRTVVEELVENGEVDITSRYLSLNKQQLIGDFRFVVLEKFLSFENDLPLKKRIIMEWYFNIKEFTSPESKWFGLDTSSVKVEKVPLVIMPAQLPQLKRVMV